MNKTEQYLNLFIMRKLGLPVVHIWDYRFIQKLPSFKKEKAIQLKGAKKWAKK